MDDTIGDTFYAIQSTVGGICSLVIDWQHTGVLSNTIHEIVCLMHHNETAEGEVASLHTAQSNRRITIVRLLMTTWSQVAPQQNGALNLNTQRNIWNSIVSQVQKSQGVPPPNNSDTRVLPNVSFDSPVCIAGRAGIKCGTEDFEHCIGRLDTSEGQSFGRISQVITNGYSPRHYERAMDDDDDCFYYFQQ